MFKIIAGLTAIISFLIMASYVIADASLATNDTNHINIANDQELASLDYINK